MREKKREDKKVSLGKIVAENLQAADSKKEDFLIASNLFLGG